MNCLSPCEAHRSTQRLFLGGNATSCRGCVRRPPGTSVASSEYAMALGALSAYQFPPVRAQVVSLPGGPKYVAPPSVNWNQSSDRRAPSRQVVTTRVKSYPGFMSPGGNGCDIKHGSYARYLNRLKAQKPLRGGLVAGCKQCVAK
jgi:hypothetical protein